MTLGRILLTSSIFSFFSVISPVNSQIIPDRTTNTSILNDCQNVCNITGGTVAGQNLFHSFQEFNVRTGESVYFADPGVANIFSRVTGSNVSQIFGRLGVSGDANLFLLNPNGIVFSAGASLDLNGSFLATTADLIEFGARSFSALPSPEENLALLTIDPSALFINQMGQNHLLELNSGALLSVPEGENITLIGTQATKERAGITIANSTIQAPQGNVTVAALKDSGRVELEDNLRLNFPDNLAKGDISLLGGSAIEVSGVGGGSVEIAGDRVTLTEESQIVSHTLGEIDGGEIEISANNLTITDNSGIITSTQGMGNSSDINIEVEESIEIIGRDIAAFQEFLVNTLSNSDRLNNSSSIIYTYSLAEGTAGNIKIDSQNLTVKNGAWILASTIDVGKTGSIVINTEETLTIDSSGLITGSAIASSGDVKNVTINSQNLLVQNGGVISSSTLGTGQGGNINLTVLDSINLRQSLPSGIVATGIYSNTLQGSGRAGDLNIDTGNLIIEDGSELSSASGFITSLGLIPFGGQGGDITINATDSVEISGSSPNGQFASGIVNNTYSNNPAGNISIDTERLSLQGEGVISASAIGTGDGGDLTIVADDSIHLSGIGLETLQQLFLNSLAEQTQISDIRGGLLTNTQTGKAGDISITSPSLILENGALISTTTLGQGIGGDLNLVTEDLNILASAIASSTLGTGQAGTITVDTERLSTSNSGIIASSSVGLGNAGDILVNASDYIQLLNTDGNALIPGGISTSSVGLSYSGDLEINTKDLTILGGSTIDATNGTQNPIVRDLIKNFNLSESRFNFELTKNVTINAESIKIAGSSPNNIFTSGIAATTLSQFSASNLQVNADRVSIADRGEISVESTGDGQAGNLEIIADSLYLDNNANLNGSTFSGTGGNINLEVKDILSVTNGSEINTDAQDFGDGGNINIDTTLVVVSEGSEITANALSGQGGNISIEAKDLFLTPDSQVSASSELGIDGQVEITTFTTSDRYNLAELPQQVLQADNLIVKTCNMKNNGKDVFIYTGRGGLPANPLVEAHGDKMVIADFTIPQDSITGNKFKTNPLNLNPPTPKIVEAEGWKVNQNGKVELIASSNNLVENFDFYVASCP